MKRFLTLVQMCDHIGVGKSRYYEMLKSDSQWYDPDLPKPRDIYGDSKQRFYSEDIEKYVELRLQRSLAA